MRMQTDRVVKPAFIKRQFHHRVATCKKLRCILVSQGGGNNMRFSIFTARRFISTFARKYMKFVWIFPEICRKDSFSKKFLTIFTVPTGCRDFYYKKCKISSERNSTRWEKGITRGVLILQIPNLTGTW